MAAVPAAADVTLGLLGGAAAGVDPAQEAARLLRFARRFPGETGPVLARSGVALPATAGITTVPAHPSLAGPLGDVAALARACATPWLLTVPVDVYDVNDCLLRTLARCSGVAGAVAGDDDGLQARVALYRTARLRDALAGLAPGTDQSLASLQACLALAPVRLAGVRFGHCAAAGAVVPVTLPRPSQD